MKYPLFLVSLFCFYLTAVVASAQSTDDWTLVWSDEFDQPGALDTDKWGFDLGRGNNGWGNNEVQTYTDELDNARVENGNLIIEAQQVLGGRTPGYTSARVVSKEKFDFMYGRVEVRAKVPSETGTWSAIWMLSSDALLSDTFWPNNGEIDIMEHVGYEEDPLFLQEKNVSFLENVHATLHTDDANHLEGGGIGRKTYKPNVSTEFHVYTMNWYPDRIEIFIDDEMFFEVLRDRDLGISQRNPPDTLIPYWPFTQRFHLLLNIAVGGDWGGHFRTEYYEGVSPFPDGIDHDGVWPQRMEVDYIRVYDFGNGRPKINNALPGTLAAKNTSNVDGVLFSNNEAGSHDIFADSIDAGDFIEFTTTVAGDGTYSVVAEIKTSVAGKRLRLTSPDDVSIDLTLSIPQTDNAWTSALIGSLALEKGKQRLRFTALDAGIELGDITISAEANDSYKGLPLDLNNVLRMGDWLGPVGIEGAPWLYLAKTDSTVYPAFSNEATWSEARAWYYVSDVQSLLPEDTNLFPWFYSKALERWCYSAESTFTTDPSWIQF